MKAPPPRTGEITYGPAHVRINQVSPGHHYLHNLWVNPDQRGHGIGTHLMHQILEEHDKAHSRITLHTARPELVQWYSRMGFHTVEEDELGTKMTRAPHEWTALHEYP